MFCPNCGNELETESRYCAKCGYDVKNDILPEASAVSKTEENRFFKKRKRLPVMVLLVAVLLVAVLGSVTLVVRSNTPERRLQKQLDLGYKHLSELDYEQAKATFEAAIKIDPKNPDGYYGLLDALVGLGDANGILLTLEKASDNLSEQDVSNISTTATHEISVMIDAAMAEKDYELAEQLNASLAKLNKDTAVIYEGLITKGTAVMEQAFKHESPQLEEDGGLQISNYEPLLVSQLKKADESASDRQAVESAQENELEQNENERITDFSDPSEEEITAAFFQAYDILLEMSCYNKSLFELDYGTMDSTGMGALVVNITNLDQLNTILNQYFSDRKTRELSSAFFEEEGRLYQILAHGTNPIPGEKWISKIEHVNNNKIVITLTLEEWEDFDSENIVGYREYQFTYIRIERGWVFDDIYIPLRI